MKVDLEQGLMRLGPAIPEPAAARPERAKADPGGFGKILSEAVSQVESAAAEADAAGAGLVTGEVGMHEAMVSMEKADLMLKLGSTIRTKLIDAYQQLVQAGGG